MMRRKIIKQKSAYTITLPVKWVRENNLEKSGEVEVDEENNRLLVGAQKQLKEKKVTLKMSKGINHYYRILIENEYLKGLTEITANYEDESAFDTISSTVSNLIGFEILEQGRNHCRIAQTAMPTVDEFNSILNRLFNIIRYAHTIILSALKSNNFSSMTEVEKIGNDVRRYSLFCRRIIHTREIASRTDEFIWDLLLERLVLTLYESYFMFEKLYSMSRDKSKINSTTIKFYEKSCSMFDIFSEMFYKKKEEFSTINTLWEEIYFKRGHDILYKCSKKESVVVFHAMNLSKMAWLISQPNNINLTTLQ